MLPKIEICHQRLGRSCNSYQFSQDFCFHFVVLLAFFALFFCFQYYRLYLVFFFFFCCNAMQSVHFLENGSHILDSGQAHKQMLNH